MPANVAPKTPFAVRGTPSGWRDPWDEPIDHAALRAQAAAAERRLEQAVAALAPRWQQEQKAERHAREHRWVAEQAMGRRLEPGVIVHHR